MMIKARTITGPKEHIAQEISHITDDILEAIVFVNESNGQPAVSLPEDIFAEMDPHTVHAGDVDYSRESIYKVPEGP